MTYESTRDAGDAATVLNGFGRELVRVTRELQVQASEIQAQNALKVAELGRWYEPEKLFAYVTLFFYAKVLIWDKALHLGATDAISGSVAEWAGAIMAFYFGKRGIENVTRIIANRFGK